MMTGEITSSGLRLRKPRHREVQTLTQEEWEIGDGGWRPGWKGPWGGCLGLVVHRLWDLPRSGIEPVSPASPGGFFTTEPPGKPSSIYILMLNFIIHGLLVHSANSYWGPTLLGTALSARAKTLRRLLGRRSHPSLLCKHDFCYLSTRVSFHREIRGLPWWSSGLDSAFPLLGAQVTIRGQGTKILCAVWHSQNK